MSRTATPAIDLYLSNNNTVASNRIENGSGTGIELGSSCGNKISDNSIATTTGINVWGGSNLNTITGNMVNWTGEYAGICIDWSNNVAVSNNYLWRSPGSRSGSGILVTRGANHAVISGNIGFDEGNSTLCGIQVYQSSYASIFDNVIQQTNQSIILSDSIGDVIYHNTLTSNLEYGVFLYHSNNINITANDARYNGLQGIYLDYSNCSIVKGNDVTGNGRNGIRLWTSSYNTISSNRANGHSNPLYGVGIFLDYRSNNNIITGNEAMNNTYGIVVYVSNNTVISYNNASFNVQAGIFICGGLPSIGYQIDYCSNCSITCNTAMYNFGNATGYGVLLNETSNSYVWMNLLSHNGWWGLMLNASSDNCYLHDNNFVGNTVGHLVIENSSYNMIYHNNFFTPISNGSMAADFDYGTGNSWAWGYPQGGNYWWNVTAPDNFKGSGQNEAGPDGIVDSRYKFCTGDNISRYDPYPLAKMYGAFLRTEMRCTRVGSGTFILESYLVDLMGNEISIGGIGMDFAETTPQQLVGTVYPAQTTTNAAGIATSTFTFNQATSLSGYLAMDTPALNTTDAYVSSWISPDHWYSDNCTNGDFKDVKYSIADSRAERVLPNLAEIPAITNVLQGYVQYFLAGYPQSNSLNISVNWRTGLKPKQLEVTIGSNAIAPVGGQQSPAAYDATSYPHIGTNNVTFLLQQLPVGENYAIIKATAEQGTSSTRTVPCFNMMTMDALGYDTSWPWQNNQKEFNSQSIQSAINGLAFAEKDVYGVLKKIPYINETIDMIKEYVPNFTIPDWIPIIGGHWGFGNLATLANLTYNSADGTALSEYALKFGKMEFGNLTKLAGLGIGIPDWLKELSIGVKGLNVPVQKTFRKEQDTRYMTLSLAGLPKLEFPLLGIITLAMGLDAVKVMLSLTSRWDPAKLDLAFQKAGIDLDAMATISAIVGWEKIADVRVSLSALVGLGMSLDSALKVSFNRMEVGLRAALDFDFLWWTEHFGYKWVYDLISGNLYSGEASKPPGWSVADRDYFGNNYNKFVANLGIGHNSPTSETTLVQSVFPQADPALAIDKNDNLMTLYVYDDPTKNASQSTEIYYTLWDGYQWSTPRPITDDNRYDTKPSVIYDSNGNAVAVWATINNETLPTGNITDISETIKYGEIAYSTYNAQTKTWTTPQLLTNNTMFDYTPTLAADDNGNVMAMWQVDEDNNITIGTATNQSYSMKRDYYYSIWNGSSWTPPGLALHNIDLVDQVNFAFKNNTALATWSQDTDGNSTTKDDIEIYYAKYESGNWTPPARLTTNSYNDMYPNIIYTRTGKPLLAWTSDESTQNASSNLLYYSTYDGSSWSTPTMFLGTVGVEAIKLAQDPQDNPVILWQQRSSAGADIFYSVYDTTHNTWSLTNQLTNDSSAESCFNPVITTQNDIVSTYLKGEVTYVTSNITQVYNGTLGPYNLTFPLQFSYPEIRSNDTSLYLLRHHIFKDLEITNTDIALSSVNPAPGQTVQINASVHNVGDLSLDGVRIEFQDGPDGPQIGPMQTIDTIRAGENITLSTDWAVPTEPATHNITVVVDPINEIPEENETNNIAYATAVLPDLALDNAWAWYPSNSTSKEVILNATVVNTGYVNATNIPLSFYYSYSIDPNDPMTLIDTRTIDRLDSGASKTVGLVWNVAGLQPNNYTYVYAIVDENNTIQESSKSNNIQMIPIKAQPDLTIGEDDISLSGNLEGNITMNMTVSNRGNFDAENVTVQVFSESPYYIDNATNTIMINPTNLLFNETIPLVSAKSNTTITKIWNASPGDYDLNVIVDPNDNITETNEGNNLAVKHTRIIQKLNFSSISPIDTDGDGLFNYLSTNVQANITSDGWYCMTGNLTDSFGRQVTTASNLTYLTTGIQNITLNFNGISIRQNATDGPYTVRDVQLYDSSSLYGLLLGAYPTSSYTYAQFQTPPATLANVVSDKGIDANGDGLYDRLEVEVHVNVTKAGSYGVQALLYDGSRNYTATTANYTYLGVGIQTVQLRFDGPEIFSHRINGPYNLAYVDLYNENWDRIDHKENAYNTSAYEYAQFTGGIYDVAATNISVDKIVVCQGLCANISMTVANHGDYTTAVNLTAYANATAIGTFRNITLKSGNSTTLTFTWNTTGFSRGNYTLSTSAEPVPEETNTADNTFTGNFIVVSLLGDLTGGTSNVWDFVPDGKCDGKDVSVAAKCFAGYPGCPPPLIWSANCDITGISFGVPNGIVDGRDISLAAKHFGEYAP